MTERRGFAALSLETISDRRLPENGLRVLAVMSSYSNGEDKCSVSNQQIAQHLDLPHNIVGQFKALLHELGYIEQLAPAELDSDAVYGLSKAPRIALEASSEPSKGKKAPGGRKVKHRSRGHPEAFQKWYAYYPRKMGKGAAEVAYSRARKTVSEETLLVAVKAYAELIIQKGVEKHFVPYPTTWLNQQRWEDEDLQNVLPKKSKPLDLGPETL